MLWGSCRSNPKPHGTVPGQAGKHPEGCGQAGDGGTETGSQQTPVPPSCGSPMDLGVMGPSEVPPMGHIGQGSPKGSCPFHPHQPRAGPRPRGARRVWSRAQGFQVLAPVSLHTPSESGPSSSPPSPPAPPRLWHLSTQGSFHCSSQTAARERETWARWREGTRL